MITTRAPFRISFLGGGTDFPAWYRENKGAVLSTTIDKYCYIFARWLPPYFEHKHRIVWSKIELALHPAEISHPMVREIMDYFHITDGVEIHHAGDLPARSGMGASSSFTVALIQAVNVLQGNHIGEQELAKIAIYLEQERCKEYVGSQDQTAAAYGGLNRIEFSGVDIRVKPLSKDIARNLERYVMLFFTGFQHNASEIEQEKISQISNQKANYKELYELVNAGQQYLEDGNIMEFARLITTGWAIKRSMTPGVSTDYIDFLFDRGMKAGALGGKLLGAGGGGFLCFIVEPDKHLMVKETLKDLLYVPVKFNFAGSEVILRNGV